MKRLDKILHILLLAVGLLTHSSIFAADEANRLEFAQEITIDAGALEFQLPIHLINEVPLTGFQCDLYLPEGFSVAKDEYDDYSIDIARTTFNRHSLATRDMPDGAVRIVLSSITNATFSGNDGKVLSLTIIFNNTIGAGNYTLELKNIVLTDPQAKRYTSENITGNIVVTTAEAFKLTYLVDGSVYRTDQYTEGEVITPLTEPQKEGYTFSGWSEIPEIMPASDVTVTGTFVVNKYTIRYYVGEQLIAEDEVEYGAEVVLRNYTPEDADRYSFVGWEGEKYETMPAHDIEYHANIADGIMDLSSLNDIKSIYDASGRKLSKLQRGVNVVVMKDGTKKKVVVK